MTKPNREPEIDEQELEVKDGRHMHLHNKQVEEEMDRRALYRGLHISLKLHDTDTVELMRLGGMPVSKSLVQDMFRRFNESDPRKSRRVFEEHILALIVGIEKQEEGTLPIEPHQTLLEMIKDIRTAIGAGERWPWTGELLQNRIDYEIKSHRGD